MLGLISIQVSDLKIYKFKVKRNIMNDNIENFNIILNKKHLNNEKVYKKVFIQLFKSNYEKIVLSDKIYYKYDKLLSYIYDSDINIVKGNNIYIQLLNKLIEYIFENNKHIKIEQLHLGIAMDNLTYSKLECIKQFATKVRGITILTNNPSKFDNVSKEILENTGLSISVNNNFKNGLKKCNVCINMDIDNKQVINSISNRCMYINCIDEITKIRKNFKGILINDINVNVENYEGFRSLAIAQALEMKIEDISIISLKGLSKEINTHELVDFKIFENK